MSFKDDFLEALKSVKRDILGSSESEQSGHDEPVGEPVPDGEAFSAASVPPYVPPAPPVSQTEPAAADTFPNEAPAGSSFPGEVEIRMKQPQDTYQSDFEPIPTPPPPFPPVPPVSGSGEFNQNDARQIFDFDSSELYNDDKTVISKNTVIRGSLQTQDSIRMLGQVMGDIECRSNIVIAGKIRGNTLAANAYVLDAQIDGDMICDDTVSIQDNAWILGNIRAQQADVDGKIKGNLEIRHGISIGSSSSIIGNISTDELEIKRGAFVNGQIIMYSPSRDVIDRFDHFEGSPS